MLSPRETLLHHVTHHTIYVDMVKPSADKFSSQRRVRHKLHAHVILRTTLSTALETLVKYIHRVERQPLDERGLAFAGNFTLPVSIAVVATPIDSGNMNRYLVQSDPATVRVADTIDGAAPARLETASGSIEAPTTVNCNCTRC